MFFPAPTAAHVAAFTAHQARGIMAYRRESAVVVDGLTLKPGIAVAREALRTGEPVAVTEADLEAARADAAKTEAFRAHLVRLGIENGERGCDRCDECGKTGPGLMIYGPDAGGYPTPVMFRGDCCSR